MPYDYDRGYREPWQDTMQVCPNGQVINDSFRKSPHHNKDFCDKCGEKTITNCPKCDKPIPGDIHYPHVVGGFTKTAPDFCESCGEPFPWKGKQKANSSRQKLKSL